MRRIRLVGLTAFALAGWLLAVVSGTRPTLMAQQPAATVASAAVGGGFGGGQEEPRRPIPPLPAVNVDQTRTLIKLQDKVPLNFPDDTPLEDVLKYVREATIGKPDFPEGLPIYVNPLGLQDSDRTITSTVSINLRGVPLATSLRLLLDQIGLAFFVNPDGLIIITGQKSDELFEGPDQSVNAKLAEIQRQLASLRAEVRMMRGMGGGMASGPIPGAGLPGGMGGQGGQVGGVR